MAIRNWVRLIPLVAGILAGTAGLISPTLSFANSIFDNTTSEQFSWSCGPDNVQTQPCGVDAIHAADLSAGGGVVAGTVFLQGDRIRGWAIAWAPGLASGGPLTGVTILADPDRDDNQYGTNRDFEGVFNSFAYDVDASGTKIVGGADVFCRDGDKCDCPGDCGDMLPLLWSYDGSAWQKPLVLPTGTSTADELEGLPNQGEALAINDAGTVIVGWAGDPVQAREAVVDYHAARWDLGAVDWEIQRLDDDGLSADPDFGAGNGTVAEDVNEAGTVIVGRYAVTVDSLAPTPLLGFQPGGPPDVFNPGAITDPGVPTDVFDPQALLLVRPFAWTGTTNTMTPLPLPESPPDTIAIGDARSLNAAGTVAIGWSGIYDAPDCTPSCWGYTFEATRWSIADDVSSSVVQVLGHVDPEPMHFADVTVGPTDIERLGSVANAVDSSGNVVVGEVDFVIGNATSFASINASAAIWEAGDGFAGETLQAALAARGIDLGNLYLTRATGVRVTYDGGIPIPTDIVVIGDALDLTEADAPSDPVFLVKLGGISGVTTLSDQAESFSSVASLLDQVTDDVGGPLFGLGDVVLHDLCMRPQEGHSQQPWCFFAFGTGTAYADLTGSEFVGDVGLGRYFNPSDSAALSIGASHLDVHLDDDSAKFAGTGYHIGGYLAHKPELGFQAFAAGTVGWWDDVDISRTYANGAGTATSSGSTDGTAYGLLGWLGYAMRPAPRLTATPFVQLTYLATHFDGWTESGGPFPASFGSTSGSSTDLRLGVDSSYQWDGTTKLFGSAAWVHRFDGDGHVVTGSLLAGDCDTSAPLSAFCGIGGRGPDRPADWFEGTLGVRRNLAANQVVSLSGTVDSGADFTALSARLGYSKSF
jgi:uncharacterized membrane protein